MTVDPFEWTPEMYNNNLKKSKKTLTKQKFYEILDVEIECLRSTKVPAWGFDRHDIIDLLKIIKFRIESEK